MLDYIGIISDVFTERLNISDMVSINSYNYINLLLGYGPKKEVICNIYWSAQSHGFRLIFMGGITTVNAHSMMRDQLATHLNSQHSLAQMVCILHETYYPLSSIAKLPIIPHLGIPVIISKCLQLRKTKLSYYHYSVLKFRFYRFVFCRSLLVSFVWLTKLCTAWRFASDRVVWYLYEMVPLVVLIVI